MEELLVTETNPEEPGHHRVTGIRLGTGQMRANNETTFICLSYYYDLVIN